MAYYDPRSNEEIREASRRNEETLRQLAREDEQERIDAYEKAREREKEIFRRKMREERERMPDLPSKPGRKLADHRTHSEIARDEWVSSRGKSSDPPAKVAAVRKNRTAAKETWEKRKAAADQEGNLVQKRKPPTKAPLQGGAAYKESQHPRDRFGRFAVKTIKATGRAVKGTAKGVGKAIKGTVKAVKSAHRTVKRVQAGSRRRAALEHRERKLDLHKREVTAGLKKPRATRRRKAAPAKKQGGLFGFLRGTQKKQVRRRR